MIYKSLFCAALACGVVATAYTDSEVGKIVDISPRELFVPVGFDDNDEIVTVVDGYLPDPCHRLRPAEVNIDKAKKVIVITQKAQLFTGKCNPVTVPFSTVVKLGTIASGDYEVVSSDGKLREKLTVRGAKLPGPDDYLYAPVDSVQVNFLSGDKLQAEIYGRFTNSCLRLEEVKVIHSGKSIELLPIMNQLEKEESGKECQSIERPYQARADLPALPPARYLLHVRSLNGESVNEIFNAGWGRVPAPR